MEQLTRHPLSAIWGDMPEDQYRKFVAGIEERHIRQMIMTLDGMVLDGWHRYKACLELGIDPFFAGYTGDDPAAYVIAHNANRRHLSRIQYRVGILLSHGIRGWGEHGEKRGADSAPLPPSIQEHITKHGGGRRGWMDALAIVRAGYGPDVMSGEPAQPYLDIIRASEGEDDQGKGTESVPLPPSIQAHQEEGTDDDIRSDSQPDASFATDSNGGTEPLESGTEDIHTGDGGSDKPVTGESEAGQFAVGPEGTGQGLGPPKAPKPKQPTRAERLEAQVDALSAQVQDTQSKLEQAETELEFHRGNLSDRDIERHQAYTRLQNELTTAKTQVNHWQARYNEANQSRVWWEKQAKALGWQPEAPE